MSWKPKIVQTNKPVYIAIAEQLEQDIKSGNLLPGTQLPPQRELADFLDINVSTISRAFKTCTQKGLLSSTIGSGTFVSYDSLANLHVVPQQNVPSLIELGSLIPEDISYEEITQILKKMMAEPDFGRLFGYGNLTTTLWQKEAVAKLIARAGYQATKKPLLPATGGQNAIAAILAGLFHAGDRIGTDPLTYPGVKSAAKMLGIQLVPIRHEQNEVCEGGLLYACKNDKIKGLYIMPDYQNPTAHMMSDQCRSMIARVAKEQGLIIIEDGIHSLLCKHPQKAVAAYAPEQTVYIASLSKTISPGLRLSYIVTPKQYQEILADALYNLNLTVSPFLLELASRVMASEKAMQLADTHRRLAVERNKIVNEILEDYTVLGADESIFRWLILPGKWTGESFERVAYEAGVQVYGSERFAVGKAKPVAAVRLAVAAPKTPEDLKQALITISALLKSDKT
ncbi:MAG TPA: PLP-dependent aminotransferase family protein [Selenomonadales bacterium]|nr:PLP-dependent aminotransferase family protein [Selenomonadales bacterium]